MQSIRNMFSRPPQNRGSSRPLQNQRSLANPWTQASPLAEPEIDFSGFADDDTLPRSAEIAAATAVQPAVVDDVGPIAVSAKVEYAALPRGRAQEVFGLVTVRAAAEAPAVAAAKEEARQPLDLICVLDVSGSMEGEKLQQVQAAMGLIIQESQPQDRLSIVTFSHVAARPLRLRRMDAEGKQEASMTTSSLDADGGTIIGNGLRAAVEVAERRRERNTVGAIFLLTDGQDERNASDHMPLLDRARAAGCSVYAFGFGADHDSRLLSALAEHAKTPFTFVEDVENIRAAFAGAMGGLTSVIAQDVKVVLNCSVPLKAVHTPFSMLREGDRVEIRIPDMLAGERRDLLVELSVPADGCSGEDLCLLEVSAHYWNLVTSAAAQTASSELRLRCVAEEEPQPELEPDEEVVTQRQRVEAAQALQDAAAHGDSGRFDEAQKVLSAQVSKLKATKNRTPVSRGLELELEDAQNRMRDHSVWTNGGSAEVRDAVQMHKMQRATNLCASKATTNAKCSKAMYVSPMQAEWLKRSG